ncbi:carbohydrate binding domain-containing protein [Streptomyces filamentosus]|uniref:carbohydrate binding domain-containing protein n=1 Tax=Streptomyces filamentosus TaxID=67294 RepID=UPI0037D47D90
MTTTRVTVQAGFGYAATDPDIVWTDLTGRVQLSATEGISITRGAADELADIQTGTMTLRLDNEDGALTPGSAASPYYPNVRRNCPIRVLSTVLEGINYLTNPGFTSNDSGWEGVPDNQPDLVTVDTAHVRSGTYALKLAWANSGTGGVMAHPLYGLDIGVPYTASVYVWVPAGDPAVRLDVDGVTVGAASTLTDQWQRISVTWTTTAATHTLRFTTTTTSPVVGDVVWMDEAQVEAGPVATAWSGAPATHHARFYGVVSSWPMTWSGLHSTIRITASDMMKWLSRRPALGPMLVEEVLGDEAKMYYPLSEPESSVSAGDQSGYSRSSLTIRQLGAGGSLTFGAGSGPPSDELPAPVFAPASSAAGKSLQAYITPRLTSGGDTGEPIPGDQAYECWFSTTVPGRCIMQWTSGGPAAFESGIRFLLDAATGRLRVFEYISGGTPLNDIVLPTPGLADGQPHHLVWDEAGADVWVDGVRYPAGTQVWMDRYLLTVGSTAGDPAYSVGGGAHWDGTISHVAAYVRLAGWPTISEIVEHYAAGMNGHAGELSWIRMYRLAGYARLPGVVPQGSFSAVASQGVLGSSPLTHMRDVERTENGRLFADRASAELIFQSRTVRYNPTPAAALAYGDLETPDLEVSDDDQKQVNVVVASRPGGATQRIQDPASIALDGVVEQPLDILKTSDDQVIDAATWLVTRYADPQPEIRQVPVQAASMPTATYRALLDADVSTALTITSLPDEAIAPTSVVLVEGYTEQITANQHRLNYHTSRADIGAVWILGDPTYSVLGTTTRLGY